jgi:pyruvate dehydrogenase E2 component (dihydrolipoamide acetyltransferase)
MTMAIPIIVPRRGWSMEEGTFVEWLRRDGDGIEPGDPLFVLENEKATENVEALDPGILRIPADGPKPGELVRVGQALAYLVADGESLPAPSGPSGPSAVRPRELAPVGSAPPICRAMPPASTQAASPRARRLARQLGIDWTTLAGTGRNGRVRERDVRAAAAMPQNCTRRE